MKNLFLLLSVVGILFFSVPLKAQTTVTINPVKDNTLYQQVAGNLSNGAGDHFFVGTTNQGLIRRGLLQFDIASNVPAGATILEATLALSMDKTLPGPSNIELHIVTTNWGEGASVAAETTGTGGGIGATAQNNDATWLHSFYNSSLWTTAGGDFSPTVSASTSVAGIGSYSWTSPQLAADIQNWLTAPTTNFGWCLTGDETKLGTVKRFASREIATITSRPGLTITFTPPVSALETNTGSRSIVYPNPSTGKMQLVVSDVPNAAVKVYNIMGRTVYSELLIEDQLTIDLSKEPAGIYFYELLSNQGIVETGKIVIRKEH